MKRIMMTLGAATTMYLSTAAVVSAQSWGDYLCSRYGLYCGGSGGHNNTTPAPEIDVSSGALALAAVGAMLLLAWEIKRRRTA
ncbi:MAG: VPEID-CTERM sorting domain-containing protein [Phycisphaerales bacterium]